MVVGLRVAPSDNLGEDGKPTERLKAEASRRTVPIPSPLVRILTAHLAKEMEIGRGGDSDLVLMSERGTPYSKRRAHSLFQTASKKAKLEGVRPHDCRHSYGSILLDKGVPLPAVSRLLGHSNVQTTARVYAGVVEGREQAMRALVEAIFARSGDHEVTTADIPSSQEKTEMANFQAVS